MKITEVTSYLLTAPRDLHIIKIETDSGIYGLGEAGCSTREYAQDGALRHLRQSLIGMDPMRIEHIWQMLYRGAYYEGGRILTAAISAIDMALYDIVGKALGVPVYQLLGGACRDRIYGFARAGRHRPTDNKNHCPSIRSLKHRHLTLLFCRLRDVARLLQVTVRPPEHRALRLGHDVVG